MPEVQSNTFQDRLGRIEANIAAACRRSGRQRSEVRLMAVSKTRSTQEMLEAMAHGLTLFGENRVQEFEAKREDLPPEAEVHLIGHLQSNKSARAAVLFTAVDTIDSLRIAQRLNEAAARASRTLPVLLEIKLSGEATKTGFAPDEPELRQLLEQMPSLESLALRGLMTVPPLDEAPETARACFRRLCELRENLAQSYPGLNFAELSMGMSGDYEIAIEEGSTTVRIGTALFGARQT